MNTGGAGAPKQYGGSNNDVIISPMASEITSLTIVYSSVYSGAYQRKHQSSASLAFVRGIRRWPVNSTRKGPVTRKVFPFDDVIMCSASIENCYNHIQLGEVSSTCTLTAMFIWFINNHTRYFSYWWHTGYICNTQKLSTSLKPVAFINSLIRYWSNTLSNQFTTQ